MVESTSDPATEEIREGGVTLLHEYSGPIDMDSLLRLSSQRDSDREVVVERGGNSPE